MIELITSALTVVAKWLGFATQRDAEKNTAAVQAAASAQKEVDAQDRTKTAIANSNIEEVRHEISE